MNKRTRTLLIIFPAFALLLAAGNSATGSPAKRIHCDTPAARWEDGMVTGNGLVGTLHHGPVEAQVMVFNSHKFVMPSPDPPVPDMSDMLEPMRDLMLAGELQEGYQLYYDELLRRRGLKPSTKSYYGMLSSRPFHAGYSMTIEMAPTGEVRAYRRSTDYETGEVRTEWQDDQGKWIRKSFASRADDVLVTEVIAPGEGLLNVTLAVQAVPQTPESMAFETIVDVDSINQRAKYPKRDGKQGGYEGVTRVVPQGGQAQVSGKEIVITGGSRLLLLTKLDHYRDDFRQWDRKHLQSAVSEIEASYETLFQRHVAIHREIYNRVDFSLGASAGDLSLPTEALIKREEADQETVDQALLEKLFYTSRYLFLSSSGAQYAPRLSGMFSGQWTAPWAGDYTCDANVNLAVLGANIADLPECMEGYYQIIHRALPDWREAAKQFYGCRGMLAPIRLDGQDAVLLHAGPYHAHMTITGLGPWMVYPLYEHYLITGDKEYLRERVHPLLRQLALFYEDFLTRTDGDGNFVFVPSNSPENSPLPKKPKTSASINATMDIAACKHGLRMLLDVEAELGIEEHEGTRTWRAMLERMPPYLVNENGVLKEWAWPTLGENHKHRHSSHMYVVWPAYEVSPDNPETATLVPSVVEALNKRTSGIGQAHEALQQAAAWIRVKRGDQLHRLMKNLLENKFVFNSLATSHDPNHKKYNYDAILCLQGLLIEMALYTDSGVNRAVIEVLPALPQAFGRGELRGVRGRNQTMIERLVWDTDKREIHCRVISQVDQTLTFIHRSGIKTITGPAAPSPLGDHAREVRFIAGEPVDLSVTY